MPTQLKTKVNTANTQKESKQQKLLSSSIKNLRENLTDLSLDEFLRNTLETVMGIERQEYLTELNNPSIDKGNGHYNRAFNNLSKNSMVIKIPRTRKGSLSLNTLELLKLNRSKLDDITFISLQERIII
mgnify:FL=1